MGKDSDVDHFVYRIAPGTWTIQDWNSGDPVNTYLLEGEEKAMLIDSGYGRIDLPAICASLTSKPVFCVLTHGHVDHAMGARRFEHRFIHSADYQVYLANERFAGFSHSDISFLDGFPSFDLGERVVFWHRFPGHTPGSIVLFDRQTGLVFDGDSENTSLWLFLPEACSASDYRNNLLENISWMSARGAVGRFSGHSDPQSPLSMDMSDLVSCADDIVEGSDDFSYRTIDLGELIRVKVFTFGTASILY